jgi:hypothetical protein
MQMNDPRILTIVTIILFITVIGFAYYTGYTDGEAEATDRYEPVIDSLLRQRVMEYDDTDRRCTVEVDTEHKLPV